MNLIAKATSSGTSLLSTLPLKKSLILATATSLFSTDADDVNDTADMSKNESSILATSPRAKSCIYMAAAMALHFGGYEFARSGALALFTSSDTGFANPAAFPAAFGLVTPVSLILLYWYGIQLKAGGPRVALRNTKLLSVGILSTACIALSVLPDQFIISKAIVAILFVFQNSYAHLLYTQQWSFLGSVMTPSEGTRWFSAIAGLSSLVCTVFATIVHNLAHHIGLLGLIGGTAATLTMSLIIADQAYALSQKHGFDPAETVQEKKETKREGDRESSVLSEDANLVTKTAYLFKRVPTLAALFGEVVTFQSLSTILNVCFVRQLKETMPIDTDRASFTGKFYAWINGSSGLMQFFVLPLARKYLEPKWAYKIMPLALLPLLGYLNWAALSTSLVSDRTLMLTTAAFFSLKTLDYSIRNVVNEMVYQPLDFESRYLGKEVIGVFANRFGKSGMSILISLASSSFSVGVPQLSQAGLVTASFWGTSSWWLSTFLVSNKEAEKRVQERQRTKDE